MDIPTDLKNNLIADVENICEMDLPSATRISLERAFEITIGTYTLTNTTKIAKKLNKLIIGDVSKQRELLIAYTEYLAQQDITTSTYWLEVYNVDAFLKSNL